jgi:hypothetical protein
MKEEEGLQAYPEPGLAMGDIFDAIVRGRSDPQRFRQPGVFALSPVAIAACVSPPGAW